MISSKHWEKSSSLTGQIPPSRAWRSISFWSSISLRRATSILLAGWWLTYWIQCFPKMLERTAVKKFKLKTTKDVTDDFWDDNQMLRRRLTSLNPLAGWQDGVQNVLLFWSVLHWWQLTISLRGSKWLLERITWVSAYPNLDRGIVQH